MINIETIIFLTVLIVGLVFIIKFWKRKAHRYIIIGVYILCLVFVILIGSDFDNEPYVPDQIVSDSTLDLRIMETTDRSYLLNGNNEVRYVTIYDKKPKTLTNWNPIYLREMDNYYIVVYSKNKDKKITYDRFRQSDYERHDDIDLLVVIDKHTGNIFHTTHYDLIGHEIDLTSFQEGHNIVTFNVFLPYEDKIAYVRYFHYTDDYSIDGFESKHENFATEPMGGNWVGMIGHTHTPGDPSWVEDFIIYENLYYYEDSYGTAYYGYLDANGPWISFIQNYDLSSEIYAQEGYLKFNTDGLYYVDNDLNLCLLNGTMKTVIASDISIDVWESYIE